MNTPLETAIWQDLPEMVTLLLEFGADPNQQNEVTHSQRHGMLGGDTPLHNAVYKGSAKWPNCSWLTARTTIITDASGLTPIEAAERKTIPTSPVSWRLISTRN
jgi:hypothetical protein